MAEIIVGMLVIVVIIATAMVIAIGIFNAAVIKTPQCPQNYLIDVQSNGNGDYAPYHTVYSVTSYEKNGNEITAFGTKYPYHEECKSFTIITNQTVTITKVGD